MSKRLAFDTRDKKPNLYILLGLTICVAALIGVLIAIGSDQSRLMICKVIIFYSFMAMIFLIWAFRGQIRYNPYSYNTIFYFGFALFAGFVMIIYILLDIHLMRETDLYRGSLIIHAMLGTAFNFMIVSAPFFLIFSIALCTSNIALIRHEGKRFVNVLGIILSFLLVGGVVVLFRLNMYATGSQWEVMMHDVLVNFLAAVYLYFECMLIGTMVADAITARHEPEKDKDFVIILGCGIRKDGKPTPLLRGRIDRALAFAKEQEEKTGKKLTFITSGGQGPDEVISESASMKGYLLEQGIPAERIVEEDKSSDTQENMKFSKEKIWAINPGAKVAYSTTNYHVFRSGLFARQVNMRAVGMGAKTKWYFWPNAAVREFVGLLTQHKVKQLLILGSMLVFYVTLTIVAYTAVY